MSLMQVLWWCLSILILALLVFSVGSLLRSPLDPQRRLLWIGAIFVVPVIGCAVWLWWRYWYYPHRLAEEPDWDPNDRARPVNLARKSFRDLQNESDS